MKPAPPARRLRMERLEPRALLANDLGEIRGLVFIDRLNNGFTNDDQLVSGATINLFRDDGDGVFEPGGDDLPQASTTSNGGGSYLFSRLTAGDYWVSQPAQTVSGRPLAAIENLLTISALEAGGDLGVLVDSFDTPPSPPPPLVVNGSTGANNASAEVVTGGEVLGNERDFLLFLSAPNSPAIGQAQMGIAGGNLFLTEDNSARGVFRVTWDGLDADGANINGIGLRGGGPTGVDLTTNGAKSAFLLEDLTATVLGSPGNATVGQLRISVITSPGNFSALTIPVVEGFQRDLVLNFADFTIGDGTGADFTNVGAIQLEFAAAVEGVGLQLDNLQAVAPSVTTFNFASPGSSDLSLLKTVDNANPTVGGVVRFTITVNNAGPDGVSGVEVTDLLPAGLTFISSAPSQGTYNSGTGVWNVGAILAGGAQTLEIFATVDAVGPISNQAEVTASDIFDPDSTPNNGDPTEDDQAQVTLNLLGLPQIDLELSNTVNQPAANVQEPVTFTLTLVNNSAFLASGVVVDALLPSGLAFISATPSQGVYDPVTGEWLVGSLFGSGVPVQETLQITALVTQPGQIALTAEVFAADQTDSDSTPNNGVPTEDDLATASVFVNAPAVDLAVSISSSALETSVNEQFTLTFTVAHANLQSPTNAQAVGVAIQLPPEFLAVDEGLASQGEFAFNTNNTGGTWTIGILPVVDSATLSLLVQANQPGLRNVNAQVFTQSPDLNPDNDFAQVKIQSILITIIIDPPAPPAVFFTAQVLPPTRLDSVVLPIYLFSSREAITIVSVANSQPITESNGWEPPYFPWIRDQLAIEDAAALRAEQTLAENERQNRRQSLARRLGSVEEDKEGDVGESQLSQEFSALLLNLASQTIAAERSASPAMELPAAPQTPNGPVIATESASQRPVGVKDQSVQPASAEQGAPPENPKVRRANLEKGPDNGGDP